MKKIVKFIKDEGGVTAIEYALVAFFIAVVIVFAVTALGNQLWNLYNNIAAAI
jgi:pilus assembly protein Flp/PilA